MEPDNVDAGSIDASFFEADTSSPNVTAPAASGFDLDLHVSGDAGATAEVPFDPVETQVEDYSNQDGVGGFGSLDNMSTSFSDATIDVDAVVDLDPSSPLK